MDRGRRATRSSPRWGRTPSPPTKSFPNKSPRVELSRRLPIKLYGHENSHPLELRVCLSQTLRNPNSQQADWAYQYSIMHSIVIYFELYSAVQHALKSYILVGTSIVHSIVHRLGVHPVSVRRFPSFRTQPLESFTPLHMNKWVPEQPSPWRKSSKRESSYGDWGYLTKPSPMSALSLIHI